MRLDKPWLPLEDSQLERIGAQLGVYELADESDRVLYIDAADARSLFGLRGELEHRIGSAVRFLFEVNTEYRTRIDNTGSNTLDQAATVLWGGLSHYSIGLSFNKTGFVNHRLR